MLKCEIVMKRKIVILSGAGVSAESGIKTFRDSNGLWEEYRVEDVASIDGWYRNPEIVQEFYNQRRVQLSTVEPNRAHKLIAQLERDNDVVVITQNVDNLHERAGSSKIIHLHGELTKITPEDKNGDVYDIGYQQIKMGDCDSRGVQLRPYIVWFGEDVPEINRAAEEVATADILLIIGTSLNVYPAAGLIYYAKKDAQIYLIDPNDVNVQLANVVHIKDNATSGMEKFIEQVSA